MLKRIITQNCIINTNQFTSHERSAPIHPFCSVSTTRVKATCFRDPYSAVALHTKGIRIQKMTRSSEIYERTGCCLHPSRLVCSIVALTTKENTKIGLKLGQNYLISPLSWVSEITTERPFVLKMAGTSCASRFSGRVLKSLFCSTQKLLVFQGVPFSI